MADRVFNFSPGPATLPYEVLQKAGQDVVNFQETGIGLIEISHRSKEFMAVTDETEANLRELMQIPDNYKVLFLQGGASSQFFMVPMNLLGKGKKASYLNTGTWSKKAIKEARLFGEIEVPFSSEETGFNQVPKQMSIQSLKTRNIFIMFQITQFTVPSFLNCPKLTKC